eukprot:TRINITY_DN22466_c0_g1_i3.p1 TRINITY_DN22466_c0_g1~~TRINITY_DN22466_c0_g1_i3.p1  ORF type:complete len:1741 (-),score=393.41 TRINITY_DN22466_c0_g1_i3:247-5469(-)
MAAQGYLVDPADLDEALINGDEQAALLVLAGLPMLPELALHQLQPRACHRIVSLTAEVCAAGNWPGALVASSALRLIAAELAPKFAAKLQRAVSEGGCPRDAVELLSDALRAALRATSGSTAKPSCEELQPLLILEALGRSLCNLLGNWSAEPTEKKCLPPAPELFEELVRFSVSSGASPSARGSSAASADEAGLPEMLAFARLQARRMAALLIGKHVESPKLPSNLKICEAAVNDVRLRMALTPLLTPQRLGPAPVEVTIPNMSMKWGDLRGIVNPKLRAKLATGMTVVIGIRSLQISGKHLVRLGAGRKGASGAYSEEVTAEVPWCCVKGGAGGAVAAIRHAIAQDVPLQFLVDVMSARVLQALPVVVCDCIGAEQEWLELSNRDEPWPAPALKKVSAAILAHAVHPEEARKVAEAPAERNPDPFFEQLKIEQARLKGKQRKSDPDFPPPPTHGNGLSAATIALAQRGPRFQPRATPNGVMLPDPMQARRDQRAASLALKAAEAAKQAAAGKSAPAVPAAPVAGKARNAHAVSKSKSPAPKAAAGTARNAHAPAPAVKAVPAVPPFHVPIVPVYRAAPLAAPPPTTAAARAAIAAALAASPVREAPAVPAAFAAKASGTQAAGSAMPPPKAPPMRSTAAASAPAQALAAKPADVPKAATTVAPAVQKPAAAPAPALAAKPADVPKAATTVAPAVQKPAAAAAAPALATKSADVHEAAVPDTTSAESQVDAAAPAIAAKSADILEETPGALGVESQADAPTPALATESPDVHGMIAPAAPEVGSQAEAPAPALDAKSADVPEAVPPVAPSAESLAAAPAPAPVVPGAEPPAPVPAKAPATKSAAPPAGAAEAAPTMETPAATALAAKAPSVSAAAASAAPALGSAPAVPQKAQAEAAAPAPPAQKVGAAGVRSVAQTKDDEDALLRARCRAAGLPDSGSRTMLEYRLTMAKLKVKCGVEATVSPPRSGAAAASAAPMSPTAPAPFGGGRGEATKTKVMAVAYGGPRDGTASASLPRRSERLALESARRGESANRSLAPATPASARGRSRARSSKDEGAFASLDIFQLQERCRSHSISMMGSRQTLIDKLTVAEQSGSDESAKLRVLSLNALREACRVRGISVKSRVRDPLITLILAHDASAKSGSSATGAPSPAPKAGAPAPSPAPVPSTPSATKSRSTTPAPTAPSASPAASAPARATRAPAIATAPESATRHRLRSKSPVSDVLKECWAQASAPKQQPTLRAASQPPLRAFGGRSSSRVAVRSAAVGALAAPAAPRASVGRGGETAAAAAIAAARRSRSPARGRSAAAVGGGETAASAIAAARRSRSPARGRSNATVGGDLASAATQALRAACRACGLLASGSREELIGRLQAQATVTPNSQNRFRGLSMPALREECRIQGLNTVSNKRCVLIERLEAHAASRARGSSAVRRAPTPPPPSRSPARRTSPAARTSSAKAKAKAKATPRAAPQARGGAGSRTASRTRSPAAASAAAAAAPAAGLVRTRQREKSADPLRSPSRAVRGAQQRRSQTRSPSVSARSKTRSRSPARRCAESRTQQQLRRAASEEATQRSAAWKALRLLPRTSLREECRQRGLAVSGSQEELADRLEAAMHAPRAAAAPPQTPTADSLQTPVAPRVRRRGVPDETPPAITAASPGNPARTRLLSKGAPPDSFAAWISGATDGKRRRLAEASPSTPGASANKTTWGALTRQRGLELLRSASPPHPASRGRRASAA